MYITGKCLNANIVDTIVNEITTKSNWTQISNWTDNDSYYPGISNNNAGNNLKGSDGYVLKSPPVGKFQRNVYVRLKYMKFIHYYNSQVSGYYSFTNNYPTIFVQTMEGFLPNVNTGQNGQVIGKNVNGQLMLAC